MKTRSLLLITVSLLTVFLIVASCGETRSTTSSTPATTSTPPDFSTQQVTPSDTTTTPGSKPPGTTTPGGTTSTGTTIMPSDNVLGDKALTLEPSVHGPAIYATMCLTCHGEGAGIQQFPLVGTWPGTPKNPGPWIVIKGSPADHTGRTDVFACTTQKGCHNKTGF